MPFADSNARRQYNKVYHSLTYPSRREAVLASNEKWRKAHREKATKYSAKWRANHPAEAKKSSERSTKKWKADNPDKYAAMQKNTKLKRRYGVTQEQVDRLLIEQKNLCAICRNPLPLEGSGRHLDHDHITSKLRGALCRTCNLGLGHFKDSLELLEAAIAYLRNPPAGGL